MEDVQHAGGGPRRHDDDRGQTERDADHHEDDPCAHAPPDRMSNHPVPEPAQPTAHLLPRPPSHHDDRRAIPRRDAPLFLTDLAHDGAMEELVAAGLGLGKDDLTFGRTTDAWLAAGGRLGALVAEKLGELVAEVEQIGSSSVLGLLAKPIIDLAAGVHPGFDLPEVTRRLQGGGWIDRGDAGEDGGHVFVLEAAPRHRVAHLHVVVHGGRQWVDYLRLRELLRRDPAAVARYEAVKLELSERGLDRTSYQAGKAAIVDQLLALA